MQPNKVRPVRTAFWIITILILLAIVILVYLFNRPHLSTPTGTATAPKPTASSTKITKLLVFVEENHSLPEMKTGMPYAYSLAKKYGYATNYHATTHPSLPNYLAIATGSTQGITNDDLPAANAFDGTSVFGQALSAHKTGMVFADTMGATNCLGVDNGHYSAHHNPWVYIQNERTYCEKFDVSMANFKDAVSTGKLPNAGMVVPDKCDDAHDCSLSQADTWFKQQMSLVFNGPDWKSDRLAIVLTADEDDKSNNNVVLTEVIAPSLHHAVVKCNLNHYSLGRLYSEVLHTTPLLNAKTAPSMAQCFKLPL